MKIRINPIGKVLLLVLCLGLKLIGEPAVTLSPGDELAPALTGHDMVTLLPGIHKLTQPVDIRRDLTIVFQNGAEITADFSGMLRIRSGCLILEGIGKSGVMRCTAKDGKRGFLTPFRASIIDMNNADNDASLPSLVMRNISMFGFNCIDGYLRADGKKGVDKVHITGCHFDCKEKAVAFNLPSLGEIRVENCTFVNCDEAIMADCPVPGGAIVRGNVIRHFGRRGILLGKSGQVADGCTTHLPNAIVQDNQLIDGGNGATVADSYTQGILIYGHNVSVIGNILRDVNRGQEIPGQIGRIMVDDKGQEQGNIRVDTAKQKNRRLAGAAIYLKANRAIVQGNICTNSGWRSVIEIKTGGKEHFVSVLNNVVDGRALAKDGSFGFECNSGRSFWSGNLVYDLPNQAFVVRSGYENTFTNNLIINAKVGFALSGNAPGQGELLSGNRFINVEHPIAIENGLKPASGTDVYLPGLVRLNSDEDIPEPTQEWLGRQILKDNKMYICIAKAEKDFRWMELSGPLLPKKVYNETGPELALNPDQSSKKTLNEPELDNPLHRGWKMAMESSEEVKLHPEDGHVSYDKENFRTGTQSLKIAYQGVSGNWSLTQFLALEPGKRYRASALLRGEEPMNLRLLVIDADGKGHQVRATDTKDWQRLSLDFITSQKSGNIKFRVWSSKTNEGKAAWLDSVSIRELQESELDENGKVIVKPQVIWKEEGGNLLANSDFQKLASTSPKGLPKPWSLVLGGDKTETAAVTISPDTGALALSRNDTKGNMLLSQNVKLLPGTRYRVTAKIKSDFPSQVILGVKTPDSKSFSAKTTKSKDWQIQTIDFTTPEKDGPTNIRIWTSNLPEKQQVYIANVSLTKLIQENSQQ